MPVTKRKRRRRRTIRAGGPLGIAVLSIGSAVLLGVLAMYTAPYGSAFDESHHGVSNRE